MAALPSWRDVQNVIAYHIQWPIERSGWPLILWTRKRAEVRRHTNREENGVVTKYVGSGEEVVIPDEVKSKPIGKVANDYNGTLQRRAGLCGERAMIERRMLFW